MAISFLLGCNGVVFTLEYWFVRVRKYQFDYFFVFQNMYSQVHEEVGVMFACIANFDEFYSDQNAVKCMRVLNEIICNV